MNRKLYLIAMVMILGLTACGKKDPEPPALEENAASEVTAASEEDAGLEEDAAEAESDDDEDTACDEDAVKVSPEDDQSEGDQPEGVQSEDGEKGWKEVYLDVVRDWNDKHGSDYSVGYQLAYINDDDIPELVLMGDDEAWYGLDIYTYTDDVPVHLLPEGRDGQEQPLTSPGCQGKGDAYIEKGNVCLQTGGMMGASGTTAYRMEGGRLVEIFNYFYADASWDESAAEPYSYTLEYTSSDGETVTVEKTLDGSDELYDVAAIPEAKDLEKEFGFSFTAKKSLGEEALSYEEITAELGGTT